MEGELGPAHGELLEMGDKSSTLAFITQRLSPHCFPHWGCDSGFTRAQKVLENGVISPLFKQLVQADLERRIFFSSGL